MSIWATLGKTLGETAIQGGSNIGMWALNNWYNKPKKQVERLKEAGINPALMYGNGGSGAIAGNTSGSPAPTNNKMELDEIYNARNSKKTGSLIDKQIRNKDAEESLLLAQASNQLSGAAKTEAERLTINYMRKISGEAMEKDTEYKNQMIKESKSRIEVAHHGMIETELNNDVLRQKAMQENINLGVTQEILENSLVFEKFKARMADNNINVNDALWQRYLGELIDYILQKQKVKQAPKVIADELIDNMGKDFWWKSLKNAYTRIKTKK